MICSNHSYFKRVNTKETHFPVHMGFPPRPLTSSLCKILLQWVFQIGVRAQVPRPDLSLNLRATKMYLLGVSQSRFATRDSLAPGVLVWLLTAVSHSQLCPGLHDKFLVTFSREVMETALGRCASHPLP